MSKIKNNFENTNFLFTTRRFMAFLSPGIVRGVWRVSWHLLFISRTRVKVPPAVAQPGSGWVQSWRRWEVLGLLLCRAEYFC